MSLVCEARTRSQLLIHSARGASPEHDLWQRVETGGAEMRPVLEELEQLEQARGVSP